MTGVTMKPLAFALLLTLCGATTLVAQNATAPGDLVPRTGTLAYITSDRPDMVYRLFGKDDQGRWKLRSFAETKWEEEFEGNTESDEARGARTILDYVFDSYESVERIELAIIDVTADGPKYLLHFKTKEGESIDIEPEFLTSQLEPEAKEFLGIRYVLYDPRADAEEEGMGQPQPSFAGGVERFYVASTNEGVLISNFETTMRGAIEKLSSGDYSESLSTRDEFKTWQDNRTPHDLSIFTIGREIQNAIERLLPSEDQAGVDAESIYRGVDDWIQFREYRYIVFDLDYDEVARGLTVSASFKTRRPTKLLKELAIEPADFKLLKYLPEGTVMTAGLQLGDAKSTFDNLKRLAQDAEGWVKEFEEGMRPPGEGIPESVPEEGDGADQGTIDPRDIIKRLRDAQDGDAEDASEVDRALGEIEGMLGEFGTSLEEVLGVLGTEVLLYMKPDVEAARGQVVGAASFEDVMETGSFGLIVALKDAEKAQSIINTARQQDPEGAFSSIEEIGYQGRTFHVSSENPFGYCFTDDALLITAIMSPGEEMTDSVVAGLRGMIDASTRTGTSSDPFVRNGSKFLEFDIGALTRIQNQLNDDLSRRLDRYAEPPLDNSPASVATDMTFAMRTKEHQDGIEFSIRVAGLPDFGQFLDGEVAIMGGGGKLNAYSYSQDNLRTLGTAMRERVDSGEAIDLDAMLKGDEIRAGVLQVPFDSRWKGDIENLGWTTLSQVERDDEGNLPGWVDEDAAKMIETNEQAGFRSIKLAEGELGEWVASYKAGFIVAYQEKAETLNGHFVLYADGQVGWLHEDALTEALKLNADGKPVPADDPWENSGTAEPPSDGESGDGESSPPEDDPWVPGND